MIVYIGLCVWSMIEFRRRAVFGDQDQSFGNKQDQQNQKDQQEQLD